VSTAITTVGSPEWEERFRAASIAEAEWDRWQRTALIAAAAGAAAFALIALLLYFTNGIDAPRQFFLSYMVGYQYWLGVGVGCLVFLMMQYLTGGAWGMLLRRILGAGSGTLLPLAVLFIPLLFGVYPLYEWADPEKVKASADLQHKSHVLQYYLNVPFFTVRAVLYFACWLVMTYFLRRWGRIEAGGGRGRAATLSGPGIVLYGLTITFASVDWVMSLEPAWYSTIYPVMFAIGQLLTSYCFALSVFMLLAMRPPLSDVVRPVHLRDFGSFLLAFVLMWAYMSFSQFLLIWVGNLPEEIPWYLRRSREGWQYVVIAIALFHFAVPFLLLLMRDIKEHARRLAAVCVGLLAMRFLDFFWWVEPAVPHEGQYFFWLLDLSAWVAVGGVCVWWFLGQLRRRPLLPLNDPYLAEALGHD
jgi:hypothetical protein